MVKNLLPGFILASLLMLTCSNVYADTYSEDEIVKYAGLGITVMPLYQSNSFGREWGYGPTFFAGIGKKYNNRFYLGGELSLNMLTYHQYNLAVVAPQLSFIPGFSLTPDTMLYGRLGIVPLYVSRTSQFSLNPIIGLGAQTKLSDKWDIRGEVDSNSTITAAFVYKFN